MVDFNKLKVGMKVKSLITVKSVFSGATIRTTNQIKLIDKISGNVLWYNDGNNHSSDPRSWGYVTNRVPSWV